MKKKNKTKLLFIIPIVCGSLLWYFVFASYVCKIIVPWAILSIFLIYNKLHKKATDEQKSLKRIKRYK